LALVKASPFRWRHMEAADGAVAAMGV